MSPKPVRQTQSRSASRENIPQEAGDIPVSPSLSRAIILEMGREDLEALRVRLEDADDETKHQIKTEIANGTAEELLMLKQQAAPEQAERIDENPFREEGERFAEDFVDRFLTEEDTDALIEGYRVEQERALKRSTLKERIKGSFPGVKKLVIGTLTSVGIWDLLDTHQQNALVVMETEKEFNEALQHVLKTYGDVPGLPAEFKNFTADDIAAFSMFDRELTQDASREEPELDENGKPKEKSEPFYEKIPGVPFVKKIFKTAESATHVHILNNAHRSLDVSKRSLLIASSMTVGELASFIEAFEEDEDADKEDENKKEIDELKVILRYIEQHRAELESQIAAEIERCGPINGVALTADQKLQLMEQCGLDNMLIMDVMKIRFGDERQRSNWFLRSVSRIPVLRRAMGYWIGDQMPEFMAKTLGVDTTKAARVRANFFGAGDARAQLKEFRQGSTRHLHVEFDEFNRAAMPDFQKRFDDFEGKVRTVDFSHGEYGRTTVATRDGLLRQYNELAHGEWSKIMGKTLTNLTKEAAVVESLQKKLKSLDVTSLHAVASTAEERALVAKRFGNVATQSRRAADIMQELEGGHLSRMLEFSKMKEGWQAKFRNLGELCDEKIVQPFARLERGLSEAGHQRKMSKKLDDIYEMSSGSMWAKTKYNVKRFGMPAIFVGTELYQLVRGEVRASEVGWDLGEAAAGFVPILSTSLDIKAAFSGKALSGRTLTTGERVASGFFAVVGAVADVGLLFGGIGYGLRAGMAGLRGTAKTAKAVEGMGKLRSLVFRGGHAAGELMSLFKAETRVRKLGVVRKQLEVHDLARLSKLERQGTATAADIERLHRLKALGVAEVRGSRLSETALRSKERMLSLGVNKKALEQFEHAEKMAVQEKKALDALVSRHGGKNLDQLNSELKALQSKDAAKTITAAEKRQMEKLKLAINEVGHADKNFRMWRYRSEGWEAKNAAEAADRANDLRRYDMFAKRVTQAGVVGATIALATGGEINPVTGLGKVAETVAPVGKAVAGAVDTVYFQDHGRSPAMQDIVQNMLAENMYAGQVEEGEEQGTNMDDRILADVDAGDPIAERFAAERGLLHKRYSQLRDVASGDAGGKVREMIG